jgi:catechol 2,3-dioxygenase-like lactoylglutathione lyase family enzyme
MEILALDHIVLCARNVGATRDFYVRVLNLDAREERPGKWALHFGDQKISLQQSDNVPEIARRTTPGTGNLCLLSETPVADIVEELSHHGVSLVEGPVERIGAVGPILSVYFYDPDGTLVEIANRL